MSIQNIKIALETEVKTLSTGITIGWENVKFVPPVDGAAYMLVHLLPAVPENPTMGDGFYREIGLMQMTLSYPVNGGSGRAYAKAQEIRELFVRGNSYVSSGTQVTIARTPSIGPGSVQGERFVLPVRVSYFANIFA